MFQIDIYMQVQALFLRLQFKGTKTTVQVGHLSDLATEREIHDFFSFLVTSSNLRSVVIRNNKRPLLSSLKIQRLLKLRYCYWYLFCCLYSHNVALEDKLFIALVTTEAETDDPESKLKPGVDLLGPVDEVFYETLDRFEPRDDGPADSCFVSTASRRIRIICGLFLHVAF
ncbi:putative GDP dissociation inhibitor [Helianthus annuus]|nr:putative GDP dissociation inhibitor [Helianthus annuus]